MVLYVCELTLARRGLSLLWTHQSLENQANSTYENRLQILSALIFGMFFVGCRKPVSNPDMLLQSKKGSLTPRDESGYTLMGTVTPRIAIPPEEDETSISVLERP
jgi:hypothetical protein